MTRAGAASPRRGPPYPSLRKGSDIGRVRRIGTRHRVGGITIFATDGDPGPSRVAVVASRAVGTAVARNRAKRRVREALRRVPLREGRDFVVTVGRAVVEVPFETLVSWVASAVGEEKP